MDEKCQQCRHNRDEHHPHELVPSFQPCSAIVYGDCYEQVCSCPNFKPADAGHLNLRCQLPGYHLTIAGAAAVQEILNRYLHDLKNEQDTCLAVLDEPDREIAKDIDYITGLAKLFD